MSTSGNRYTDTRFVSRDPEAYRHSETYRVRFDDLDTYRHVNNKSFLGWIEDARVRYLVNEAGLDHHHEGTDGVMVVHVSIDYLSQINAFEQVTVRTRCARVGTKSFTLHHLVLAGAEDGGEHRPAATAVTVFATVDMTSGRSKANDPRMIARITDYEPTPPD